MLLPLCIIVKFILLFFLFISMWKHLTATEQYSVSSYCFNPQRSAKGRRCSYVHKRCLISRLWCKSFFLIFYLMTQAILPFYYKLICFLYLSRNSTDFPKFFSKLNYKMEHIFYFSPFSEIIVFSDFKIHDRQWFSCNI